MKKIFLGLMFLFFLASPSFAATLYVRTDGGTYGTTSTTCNGASDVAFTGANGPNCALKHPYYATGWYKYGTVNPPTGGQAGPLAGGDTLIVKLGQYKEGYDSVQTFGCDTSASYDCVNRPIPSGPTTSSPTTIVGCSATGCGTGTKPELWSSGRARWALNLQSKSNIVIDSINFTDHAACGQSHATLGCGSADVDELSGYDGIWLKGSNNITIKNTWVHGFYRYGLYGSSVSNLTVIDSKIDFNSYGGFINSDECNGLTTCPDDGILSFTGTTPPTSSTAKMSVDWNGCVENPSAPFTAMTSGCYSQSNGGYGDAIGTVASKGAWIFTNVSVRHNTSDGIDMLYLNISGVTGGSLTVKKSLIEGNIGNSIKGPNDTYIEDNIIVGNCGFFSGKSYSLSGIDSCRANGNTIVIAWRNNGSTLPKIYSNTITGNGNVIIALEGNSGTCTNGINILAKNNIILGGRYFLSSGTKTTFWYNSNTEVNSVCLPTLISDYNVCTGDFSASTCATTSSSTGIKQTAGVNNQYVATPTDVFTGTISQGPTTFYTGTDYFDQLTIKSASAPRNLSDVTLVGTDAFDFNNFARGSTWDAGGLEFGTTTGGPAITCGNNIKETGEVCDGTDLNSQTCATQGFTSGPLSCAANCNSFVTSSCVTTLCGNGNIDSGEQCDGVNLNGQTCLSQGFSTGTLSCTACAFNTSSCVAAVCGNSVIDAGEQCDDGNTANSDGCSALCETEISGIEKLLLYTETDPSSQMSPRTHISNFTGISRNASSNLQYDYGAAHFGDFTHDFEVEIDSCNDNGAGAGAVVGVWALSGTSRSNLKAIEDAADGIYLYLYCQSSSSLYQWELWKSNGSGLVGAQAVDVLPVIQRFFRVARSGSTVTASIYSDSLHTHLLSTLTVTDGTAYRIFYPLSSFNSTTTSTSVSGKVKNYNLSAGGAGPAAPSYSGKIRGGVRNVGGAKLR